MENKTLNDIYMTFDEDNISFINEIYVSKLDEEQLTELAKYLKTQDWYPSSQATELFWKPVGKHPELTFYVMAPRNLWLAMRKEMKWT